ncbi:MAG TPA: hypothetical protein VK251_02930 [Steroidobacteraceae bacterium]|nr:hypothetical protein [Steroidobacteraceae bacterium]
MVTKVAFASPKEFPGHSVANLARPHIDDKKFLFNAEPVIKHTLLLPSVRRRRILGPHARSLKHESRFVSATGIVGDRLFQTVAVAWHPVPANARGGADRSVPRTAVLT